MPDMLFRVMGPLEVSGPNGPVDLGSPRQQTVLALLLASPNRVVSTERLVDEIWGATPPGQAVHSLQTYVSNLRRLLSDPPSRARSIETRRPGYLIRVRSAELDALEFAELVEEGKRLVSTDPAEAARVLREALSFWRGDPYAGLVDEVPMLQAEAARLGELRLGTLELRIEADLRRGEHAALAGELEFLTRLHPLRERLWAALMTALYRSGRQSEALRAYQEARRFLGERLGIEPSPQLRELEESILLQDPELTLPQEEARPNHNLPAQISSLVGRERELSEMIKLIDERRLVTVTGAAGSGKTRLALEAAAAIVDRFPDGVWFVALGPLRDGSLIATEMLGVMGLDSPVAKTHLTALCDQLADRETLVVVDSCEHLRAPAAEVLAAVLHAAPAVKVLATSREPLRVTGEVAWSLSPMKVPAEAAVTAGEVMEAEAVRLFVERAAAARPGFGLDEANAEDVADICRRLDGLPLAIELAAARARSLGVDEIDRRLKDRFRLLTGGDPTALPRHRTLLGAVQWSYDLLDELLQELYRRLSVLRGGFTLDAAEVVGRSETILPEDVVDLLDHLVAQSLVVAEQNQEGTRYRMLETIRIHGLDRLEEAGEGAAARAALLRWAVGLAREASRQLGGPEPAEWIRRLQTEHDNIRTAMAWALENDPVTGLEVTTSMAQFWWTHSVARPSQTSTTTSYLPEGTEWSKQMLAAAGDAAPAELRARARIALGGLLQIRLGQFEEASANLEEAEELLRPLDDPGLAGWAVHYRAISTWSTAQSSETIALFRRALRLFGAAANDRGVLFATMLLGCALVLSGTDVEEGAELLGEFDHAARKSRAPGLVAHAAYVTALFDLERGQHHAQVPELLDEAIREFITIANVGCMTHTLQTIALYHARGGDLERAARVSASAYAIRDRLAMVFVPYCGFWPEVDELDDLEPEVRDAALQVGRSMTFDEAVEYALEGLSIRG